ncbi:MAG: FRG domain-containing protein [Pirellulales bacterium]
MQDNMGQFSSILNGGRRSRCRWKDVSDDPGCIVSNFVELMDRVAELTFWNPGLNLFFRGQTKNFTGVAGKEKLGTSLLPSAYREPVSPNLAASEERFRQLAEMTLDAKKKLARFRHDKERLDEFTELTWAVLQHYGCETPLLDITQSLHVAASFATCTYSDGKETPAKDEGYVYVLGLPAMNGHLTFLAHEGMVMVKLQAACPPEAKRPHYQQGFLVGSIPSNPKPHSYRYRNLVLRLVGKFRIPEPSAFWEGSYRHLSRKVLMPPDDDVAKIVQGIRSPTLFR